MTFGWILYEFWIDPVLLLDGPCMFFEWTLYDFQKDVVGKGQGLPQPVNCKKNGVGKGRELPQAWLTVSPKNVVGKGQGLPQPVHSQKML